MNYKITIKTNEGFTHFYCYSLKEAFMFLRAFKADYKQLGILHIRVFTANNYLVFLERIFND